MLLNKLLKSSIVTTLFDIDSEKSVNILDLKLNQVSIKATTTDFLGYIGRGEGFAAQSIVTIEDNTL